MPPVSYECHASLPGFWIEYPSDWQLDTSHAQPNAGKVGLSLHDQSASVTVEWGPDLTAHGVLEEAATRYERHEVVSKQRIASEGTVWSEVVYQGYKSARNPQPDRVCVRITQRSGLVWRVGYRLDGAMGPRRRPAAEAILKRFKFLPGGQPNESAWRHHRYMASTLEFAFNHPAAWDVVPAVNGSEGTCTVELPEGARFLAQWGTNLQAAPFLDQMRRKYREFSVLLERPGLVLKSGTWDEWVFDGKIAPESEWTGEPMRLERGRYRFGETFGMSWILGYTVPHAHLAALLPSFDRMVGSMRILGKQNPISWDGQPTPKGLHLEIGLELAVCLAIKQAFDPTGFIERLTHELQLLRVLLAYEGLLLPHLPVRPHPEIPPHGWRIRAGEQTLAERDIGKDEIDPLIRIVEAVRGETPRLDAMLAQRLARPDLIQQLFPRAPNAYEKLRTMRPELKLPPLSVQ